MYAYALGDALYLNLTSACTLACVFCPKIRDGDWVVGGYDLQLGRAPSADEVWAQVERAGIQGRPEVVFTGLGEPTRRLGVLLEVARRLVRGGVRRVRIDTDGLANLREGRDVTPELAAAGVGAVVVSLNAADPETYAKILSQPARGSRLGGGPRLHPCRGAPSSPRSRRASWECPGSTRRPAVARRSLSARPFAGAPTTGSGG